MRAWSQAVLKHRLKKQNFSVRCFDYSTWRRDPLESIASLTEFCAGSKSSSMHLVGHSLGGLLIMEMLYRLSEAGKSPFPPGRVVLLGSPLAGSEAARRLAAKTAGKLLLRHAESSLIEGISGISGERECGMIAGNLPRGLGRITGRFDGPNDGTVKVEETILDGLADHLEMKVTHTGMVFKAEVARQLVFFINHGHFERTQ
jgi:pimeloyl-ACP methyl ester carboxylesterase